jgi:hypothetical protein
VLDTSKIDTYKIPVWCWFILVGVLVYVIGTMLIIHRKSFFWTKKMKQIDEDAID